MTDESSRNIRLGIFVVTGTALLIVAMYFVGMKQNLFGPTFRLSARFHDVGGLMKGNNVRFAGIDVGTVESVVIESDTAVLVTMVVDERARKYLRENAIAAVGTDGLMGNRIVNITSVPGDAPLVENGAQLRTLRAVEMDAMVRTLNVTNENIRVISDNLRLMTQNLGSSNNLAGVLFDTIAAKQLKNTLINLEIASKDIVNVTGNVREAGAALVSGKGSVSQFLKDTTLYASFTHAAGKLATAGDSAAVAASAIARIAKDVEQGKGTIGKLINDTTTVHRLNSSLQKLDSGAAGFSENMEAMKHTWPLKRYYKKKNRKK